MKKRLMARQKHASVHPAEALPQERQTQENRLAPGVEEYLRAATRDNTRRSYRAAVEHFEGHWGGLLPATADSVARYLAHYGGQLSLATLKQRLAGLSVWHQQQGFADPTKAPHVRKVIKGIAELHPAKSKQAQPIQLEQLQQLAAYLQQSIEHDDPPQALTALRDRVILLLGFWRAFRSDELVRLEVQHIQAKSGAGMSLWLARSKGDRSLQGRDYQVPALRQLCPVEAYIDWIDAAGLGEGNVFRAIDRWGNISSSGMHPVSITNILRQRLSQVGLMNSKGFSSHSLRRGFASWANGQGWDTRRLMEYVGWRDVQSALRYIDNPTPFAAQWLADAPGKHES
ncbi:site-specific integrase [Bacterioplanoides pacificum]|uniref:Site-specific integrase n=1 Tax=Bacterioplanoides pacificum TaxID=1171596 RepID=A0ABV7VR96_9GAMM